MPEGDEAEREESLPDVIEIRLPQNSDYLPLLRATAGVLAGIMSFNYDEIIQLRLAVSDAFSLAARRAGPDSAIASEISMQFVVAAEKIEILIQNRPFIGRIDTELEMESCAFLESLMDEVAFDGEAENDPLITMTKYITVGQV